MAMAEQPLLLALDQGTSGSRAAVFNTSGELVSTASAPVPIQYPADGWVEQDPMAIWSSQRQGPDQSAQEPQRATASCCGRMRDHQPAGNHSSVAPQQRHPLRTGPGLAGRAHSLDLHELETTGARTGVAPPHRTPAGPLLQRQQDPLDARAPRGSGCRSRSR